MSCKKLLVIAMVFATFQTMAQVVVTDSLLDTKSLSATSLTDTAHITEMVNLAPLQDKQFQALSQQDAHRLNKQIKTTFIPDPQRALWLSLVIPGAGQIYNRKFWKLPLVYGGFVGCTYGFLWNQQMYMDYSQAYLDIMDSDPQTNSFRNMFPPGYDVDSRIDRYKDLFKARKDLYRRWRDLSAFCFIGVYLLSVVDAYVDAQLSVFDISPDLSLQITPTSFSRIGAGGFSPSFGLGATLTF